MSSPGMRLGREQARRGIMRIAEPRHPTAAMGRSGLMGMGFGAGRIDLVAIATHGAWVDGDMDLNIVRRGSAGRDVGL